MKLALKVYRDEVVPVYTTNLNNKAVDGRELHSYLGIGKDYSNWAKRVIKRHKLVLNEDYVIVTPSDISIDGVFAKSGENPKGGRTRKEYIFQLAPAKKIAMGTNNAQGDKVKDYFLECEKAALAGLALAIPIMPLGEHTKRDVQIHNVKMVNSKLWGSQGVEGISNHHRELSKMLTGKTPSQLKRDAKVSGVPSKFRSSGRECMRYQQPDAACAASVCDELVKKGKALPELGSIAGKLKDVFGDLLRLGIRPTELSS